jgi:hypothetical protein
MLLTLMANGEAGDRLLAGVRDLTTLIKGWDGDPRKKDELAKQLDDQMSLTEIEKVIEDLPRGTLRTAALAWLNQERKAFLSTKHNIEQWVDQSMLRIGDSYKRRAQGVVWAIAAMLVLFTGADMLRMVSGFQKSENTRAAIWTVVEQLLARPEMQGESNDQVVQSVIALIDSLPDLDLVLGYGDLVTIEQDGSLKWLVPVYRSVPATSTVASASRDEEAAVVASAAALPSAGEVSSAEQQAQTSQMVIDVWATVARALRKIVGLILSVAAISIGAPFWFDVMKRVANIRSSGLPPKALGSQR